MARTTLLLIAFACVAAACSTTHDATPAPVVWGVDVPEADAAAIEAQPVVARRNGFVTLLPISSTGGIVAVDYGYDMPHCGIHSPIDVDGSFWDPVNLPLDMDPVQFDGSTGTFRLTSRNTATFTDSSGRVLHLLRHAGEKEFGVCF
ncbi:MAG TPA: hypothetical protein VJ850_07750 [Candidatus Limnocylindrales bacterium]|nr:hypothetical protein [Candidatus Limnocylindrales bacterium]